LPRLLENRTERYSRTADPDGERLREPLSQSKPRQRDGAATRENQENGMTEHKAEWLERYGADYATDEDRESAYQDHQENLAVMREVFYADDDANASIVRTAWK
jgi:hypothetical protein